MQNFSLLRSPIISVAPLCFKRSKKDARKKGIVLADKGIEHEKNAAPIIAEFDAILDDVLTSFEQEAFDAACEKLMAAIEAKERE